MVGFLLLAAGPLRAHVETSLITPAERFDTLIYKDGDQIKGHLKEKSDKELVFQSTRFGLIRVSVKEAKVVLANGEDDQTADARARTEEAENPFTVWSLLSLRALTNEVRHFFGPWSGRLAMSAQAVSDTTERTSYTAEAHLQRKWAHDNVQFNARYDFSDTSHVVTTDIFKADASWRHDFRNPFFAIYGPSMEYNRAFVVNAQPADYVLLQQEIGAGVNVFSSPQRNLRLGVAENLFDLWQVVAPESHNSKIAESVFVEADWKLPWQMKISERGVWYYSFNTGRDGWENKVELDKKLTETFTVGVRHEVRYNNPGVRVQDYTLFKVLMGIDF